MGIFNYFKKLAKETVHIIFYPEKQWLRMKNNNNENLGLFSSLLIPGLFLVFFSTVLGEIIFNSTYGILYVDILIKGIRKILLLIMVFLASTMLMYEVSRWFNVPVGFETSRQIIIYSMLPMVMVAIITGLVPFLSVLGLFSLYSLYILFLAPLGLFGLKPERNLSYLIILISSIFLAYIAIALLLSLLTALIIY